MKMFFQNFKAAINESWLWKVQGQGDFEDKLGVGKGTQCPMIQFLRLSCQYSFACI